MNKLINYSLLSIFILSILGFFYILTIDGNMPNEEQPLYLRHQPVMEMNEKYHM